MPQPGQFPAPTGKAHSSGTLRGVLAATGCGAELCVPHPCANAYESAAFVAISVAARDGYDKKYGKQDCIGAAVGWPVS